MTGRNGRRIDDAWSNGAQAYLGITTAGFPNLFMLYGPNTNNGSILFMIECQVAYVMRQLARLDNEALAWIDVRPEVMAEYNRALQDDLDQVDVWSAELQQLLPRPERHHRDPVAAHHVGVPGPHDHARRRRLRDLGRVVVVAGDPAVAKPEVGDDEQEPQLGGRRAYVLAVPRHPLTEKPTSSIRASPSRVVHAVSGARERPRARRR